MHLAYAIQACSAADHQKAVKLLAESRDARARLANTTDPVYAPLDNPLRGQCNFKWRQLLKVLEQIDAAVVSESPGGPLEFTAAEKGQPTGIEVRDVRQQIDAAGGVRIACKASAPAGVRKVLLWYKPLPSGEAWRSAAMSGPREWSRTGAADGGGPVVPDRSPGPIRRGETLSSVLQATPYWAILPSKPSPGTTGSSPPRSSGSARSLPPEPAAAPR